MFLKSAKYLVKTCTCIYSRNCSSNNSNKLNCFQIERGCIVNVENAYIFDYIDCLLFLYSENVLVRF